MYAGMTGNIATRQGETGFVWDFRSDTVTRPSSDMRSAMAKAEVGDDVYEDDPTVQALEAKLAAMAGMEAALFFSTGTQSNLAALLCYCGRGDEYIAGDQYHIFRDEAGGAAVLGGISPFPLPTNENGGITPEQVTASVKPDDPHCPISKLLCLENTVSGRVQAQNLIISLAETAKKSGLSVHLDGARIFNASVKTGLSLKELCAPVDSVSICLSKGLGAPVGSVLCGSHDLIRRAKRMRKILGGGMRQVGVLAACGLYALEHNIDRLSEDHDTALRLAEGLSQIPQVSVDVSTVETNMVFLNPGEGHHESLQKFLAKNGILIGLQIPEIRLVTHLNIDNEAIDFFIQKAKEYYTAQ
ncbi:low-specificity L-threonine aldolase [Kiloniella antarctica]|uniref:Low-specificity L-threonine aldolase n=1 Tax=Kiloniella antarctica TaxID=1550907 RepID=A0ABW5BQ21_9PROT